MDRVSTELVQGILDCSTGGHSHSVDVLRLSALAQVSSAFADAARRLIYRRVVISSADSGAKFIRSLRANPNLGPMVRSLTINISAFSDLATFSDLSTDDILRLCPQLVHYEPAIANFAPLFDGRTPAASYPRSLRHFRLAPTLLEQQNHSDSETEDEQDLDGNDSSSDGDSALGPLRRLNDLPVDKIRSLKIERLPASSLHRAEAPTSDFPLQALEKLELVFVHLSLPILDWMTDHPISGGTLTELKLWQVGGISTPDVKNLLLRVGSTLKTFEYKSQQSDMGVMINSVIPHLTVLERLSLGEGAANHHIYPLLPGSLKDLCISLPRNHRACDFGGIVTALGPTGQLQQLRTLSLYAQVWFPPTTVIEYLDDLNLVTGQAPLPSLRELRLSHVTGKNWSPFLSLVGPGLKTLSVHHLNEGTRSIINHCPNLRRCELGVAFAYLPASLPVSPSLHLLRVHLNSQVALDTLIRAVQNKKYPMLKALDLSGLFPENVDSSWQSGAKVDQLLEACKAQSVELSMNGYRLQSLGDLWGSVMAHITA